VQWFNPNLAHAADEINALPNLVAFGSVCEISHTDVSFSTNYDYGKVKDKNNPYLAVNGGGNAFCSIDEKMMQTIAAIPQWKAEPKKGKEAQAKTAWQKASRFLIAAHFSTTSTRLMAVHSETLAMGSMYMSVVVDTPEQEKAFAAFLNSSFGVIQMLNRRSKKLTYPRYEAAHLKTLMLPDPATADLAPLLEAFEAVKDTPLQRLSMCADDAARKTLDHAAARALGIDPATTDQWREWLSFEPTITGKPAPDFVTPAASPPVTPAVC